MFGCLDIWMFGCLDVWMFGCLDVWMFGRAVFSGTTFRELVMVCHLNHRTPNRYTLLRPGTKDSNVACIKCQKSKRCLAMGGGAMLRFLNV